MSKLKLRMAVSPEKKKVTPVAYEANPFMEEAKTFSREKLVNIWKVGFERLKEKRLKEDDILRYKAVSALLRLKYHIELPKDGK